MKWHCTVGCVIFSINILNAQTAKQFSKSAFIDPYKLEVTYNKTTNLIFPSAIITVDRGSQDILVQKTNGAENILKVKADTRTFSETNLSVITTDGKLYSFLVDYTAQPEYLNINIGNTSQIKITPNKESLSIYATKAARAKRNIHGVHNKNSEVLFSLTGFYVRDSVMYCRLVIINHSQINYDIDQFRLYIKDKKQSRRTASQEVEIQPLYISGNTCVVKGNSNQTLVVAVPKFTIPDSKLLTIELMEKNGGRNLSLKVKNKHIIKASLLNKNCD